MKTICVCVACPLPLPLYGTRAIICARLAGGDVGALVVSMLPRYLANSSRVSVAGKDGATSSRLTELSGEMGTLRGQVQALTLERIELAAAVETLRGSESSLSDQVCAIAAVLRS